MIDPNEDLAECIGCGKLYDPVDSDSKERFEVYCSGMCEIESRMAHAEMLRDS